MANKNRKLKKNNTKLNKSENKMKKGKAFLIAGIVFFVLATVTDASVMGKFISFLEIFSGWNTASAVGVIGGADSPTAIFVAGKFDFWTILNVALKLCCGASFITWIYKNQKEKQ